MDTLFIPTEEDIKNWVKEAVLECLEKERPANLCAGNETEMLLNRKEIAGLLRISLVTLHDWMKRGLPFHKQRGRVYLLHLEVMAYIKTHKLKKYIETVLPLLPFVGGITEEDLTWVV